MSWNSAPPINPPEAHLVECPECNGEGGWEEHEAPVAVYWMSCRRCEGSGECEFDPDDNPYQPDTWKEAEGWA